MEKYCKNCGNLIESKSAIIFCCQSCAASFNNKMRKENGVTTKGKTKEVECINCGKLINVSIHSSTKTWICDECKENKKPVHAKNVKYIHSILEFSKRTVIKILKRMKAKCSICGWNESTCDIHHIVAKKDGGTDDMENLICVCPNCHRVCHTTDKYSTEFLKNLSLDKEYKDWKNFYHPSN